MADRTPAGGENARQPRPPKRQKIRKSSDGSDSGATTLSHSDYSIGWICALPKEMAAAKVMLDAIHETLPRSENDTNAYTMGSIGPHNIVLVCLPSGRYGNNNAANVASNLRRTFRSIRICIMVGIGGGAPGKVDVRLGDVVVGERIIQYDMGKTEGEGCFKRTGSLCLPPQELLTAVAKLRADHECSPNKIPTILSDMLKRYPAMDQYIHSDALQDRLFDSTYDHVKCADGLADECEGCDASRLVQRSLRPGFQPLIHYGTVASANQVMKHGKTRDQIARETDALCFEMEGAGMMDGFAGLVIRGICDYSDSHKNKQWQEVAAAVAAAYAKELILVIPADRHGRTLKAGVTAANMAGGQNKLLQSLKFDQIDARRRNIQPEFATTCQWLLQHRDFLDWRDPEKATEHHGFLWIQGSPGTGKSTLMNFLLQHITDDEEHIVISFFFNARGAELERSVLGMYRSLLFQLIAALPDPTSVLEEYKSIAPHQRDGHPWSTRDLKQLLRGALRNLDQTPLTVFVDALDECAADEVEDLVDYFEEFGKLAVTYGAQVNICFSSRHYPHIDIQFGRKIDLEIQDGHEKDIAMYVQNKLKIGKSKTGEEVKAIIRQNAKGIFMWVVLVVEILKVEYKSGRIFDVKNRLAGLPTKLSDLFQEILTRDQNNMRDLQLCIQLILFANRPLTLEEYYFAAVSGLSPGEVCEWDPEEVTRDDMERFVKSSSKGLAETTKPKGTSEFLQFLELEHTVQFIHESVREFFLKNGLRELWPNFDAAQLEIASHYELQQCCYTYIKLGIRSDLRPRDTTREGAEMTLRIVRTRFPFLNYAIWNVLYHANATAHVFPQRQFLEEFPVLPWNNLVEVFTPWDRRHNAPATVFLCALSERNLAMLIKVVLHIDPKIDINGQPHQYPLFAALVNGHRDAVRALLQTDGSRISNDDLAQLDYGIGFRREPGQTPLSWAAHNGYMAIFQHLLEKGADTNLWDESWRSPLSYAAENGHATIVQHLLEKGADTDVSDKSCRTPLSYAAENGHATIVQNLLEKGAAGISRDMWLRSPLSYAAASGHDDIVRVLLELPGNDIESEDGFGWTPIVHAAWNGHASTVELLIDKGAKFTARFPDDMTPLMEASRIGHLSVVQLLLSNGDGVGEHSNSGKRALRWAAAGGHTDVVRLLLGRHRH